MIFEGFDFFKSFMGNPNEYFNDIITNILAFLPYVKYIVGMIFLIFGILMFLNKDKHWNKNNDHFQVKDNYKNLKRPIKLISAIICVIIALGFYFNILLLIVYFLSRLEPPMLIFNIISMNDIVELHAMVMPLTPEWSNLTQIEQIILLLIGIISMVGFFLFIYGAMLIIGQGFYGKHKGIKIIIISVIIFFILGVSPGISLLIF